jgi:hypothetical protein
MGMQFKRLNSREISLVVEKIRKKYDDYCNQFFKSKKVRVGFDDRYLQAIKTGGDLSTFLMAEISAVDQLIRDAEQKVCESQPEQTAKITSYIESIMERNSKQIEKYGEIDFHKNAGIEVKKLLWALTGTFERDFPFIDTAVKSLGITAHIRTLTAIETGFIELTLFRGADVPVKLSRYNLFLTKVIKEYAAMEREEKNFIKEAAFTLHDLAGLLMRVLKENPAMETGTRDRLKKVLLSITSVIIDFRLKDLKRKAAAGLNGRPA